MNTVYKGLLLFVLIANALALPIKGENNDGKNVVFETIRTTLNCVCYYEEGETLDDSKIDEYCDCTPEQVETDKSLVDASEVEKLKLSNGKNIKIIEDDDENLTDVQKYGSADAAYFANLEENESKQDQEEEEEEEQEEEEDLGSLVNNDGKYIAMVDDMGDDDADGVVEDIPEYDTLDDEIVADNDKKYIVSNAASNNNGDDEVIFDKDGNVIHIEVEMLGESYSVEYDDDDDDDDNNAAENDGINVPSRPTLPKALKMADRRVLDEMDEPLTGSDAKYLIDYYNDQNGNEEEEEENDYNYDDDNNDDGNDDGDYEGDDDDDGEYEEVITEEAEKYKKADEIKALKDADIESVKQDGDLRSVYKQLIIEKLKEDVKKIDSEKLIVDIIKEALSSGSNKDSPLKELLN